MLLSEHVHPRAGSQIVGVLRAAVEHNHQRHFLPDVAAGYVQLVGAGSGSVGVGPLYETSARRNDGGGTFYSAGPDPGHHTAPARRARGSAGAAWEHAEARDPSGPAVVGPSAPELH